MSYSPPAGSSVGLAFTSGYQKPLAGDINIEFDTVVADLRQVGGFASSAVGIPSLLQSRFVRAIGTEFSSFGTAYAVIDNSQFVTATGIAPTSDPAAFQVQWTQYATAEGIVSGEFVPPPTRVNNAGAYQPPSTTNLVLNWLGTPYTPPTTLNLILEFGAVGYGRVDGATLFDQSGFGTVSVASTSAGVSVPGFASSTLGTPSLTFVGASYIYYAGGIFSETFGTTLVSPRYIYVTGWENNSAVGTPPLVRDNFIRPEGIASSNLFGTQYVAWEVQHITVLTGIPAGDVGSNTIDFTIRTVYPTGWNSFTPGVFALANTRYLYPSGFGNEELGTPYVGAAYLFPTGIPPLNDFGTPDARLAVQYIVSRTASQGAEFGQATIYNLNQYAYQYWEFDLPLTEWGSPVYNTVENVNRTIGGQGWRDSRFGNSLVERGFATQDTTLGEQTLWGADTFIDFAVRYRYLDGWESFAAPSQIDTIVYNNARVVTQTGWDSAQFGQAEVLNLNREYRIPSLDDQASYGTAFIAYAIRTLTVLQGVPSENEGRWPNELRVSSNPEYIAPDGIDSFAHGPLPHYVYEHFNIAYAKSIAPRDFAPGEPLIENRNKTLAPDGRPYDEHGTPTIENYIKYPFIEGTEFFQFGDELSIGYKTRSIYVTSWTSSRFLDTNRIYRDGPEPPSQQYVIVPYFGASPLYGDVGVPTINRNQIRPESWVDSEFGTPVSRDNYIRVVGFLSFFVGDATDATETADRFGNLLSNTPQWTRPVGIRSGNFVDSENPENPANDSSFMGFPRITPSYIVQDDNPVDFDLGSTYPWWGYPDVSLRNRTVAVQWRQNLSSPPGEVFGDAELTLRRRYIYMSGRQQTRWGRPTLTTPTVETINLDTFGYDASAIGEATIAWTGPYTQTVVPTSFTGSFGTTTIDLLNRSVYPSGIEHMAAYANGTNNIFTTNSPSGFTEGTWALGFQLVTPWGMALVGPPRRVYPSGWNSFTCGFDTPNAFYDFNGFVSHKIRTYFLDGFDAFEYSYTGTGPWGNTRIAHRPSLRSFQSILSTLSLGVPDVTNGIRTVYPYSVATGYNVGSPTAFHRIIVAGWESSVFGDIDRWEEGKVKPYGSDTSLVSHLARLTRVVEPASFDGEVGSASVGRIAYPSGFGGEGFGEGPYIVNEWDCNFRVVAVNASGGEQFGTASVT